MILETTRLILRPLTLADAETAFYGWIGDAEVAEYVSWLPHHSIENTINWLKEIEWKRDDTGNTAPRDNYIWGFVLKETGELFGSGGLIWEEGCQLYQVGYNIMKSHWNNGYTTEAMKAILLYAVKNLGIKRVAGGHAKENLASANVIEKLGFIYDRDDVTPHVDGVRYFDSREYYLDLEPDEERRARIYPIVLSEYNPEWPEWFTEEKERLIRLIGDDNIVRIMHMGSTSVPGLTSKPTVDILLEIAERTDIESLITALPESEYICLRQQTSPTLDRVMFLKGYADTGFDEKVFHIHVRNPGDWDEMYFRDYLVAHPEAASEYAALKRRLLKDYEHDRDGYTAAKGEFIKEYTDRAKKDARSSLTKNLDKLHTTSLGAERIKHNLSLQTDDVVAWCSDAAKKADVIIGRGKNWYVYRDGAVITVNAHSYTIITAHKINAKVRVMRESDYECLPEFLYQAIFIPEGAGLPPRSIINDPEIFIYIKDFGTQSGDFGVVAEQNDQVVGAAWTRIIPAYGHIDSETPELAISILPEFRGYGIGTKLMKKLFAVLRENGYKQTSLSVQKDNPAVRLYQRLGYKLSGERINHAGHEDYLMIKEL